MSLAIRGKDSGPKLRRLVPGEATNYADFELTVVVVPDLSTKSAKVNLDMTWSFLADAIFPTSNILVLGFEYSLSKEFESIWNFLDLNGSILMNLLTEQLGPLQLSQRPLVTMGHGLGGLILKSLMTSIYKLYPLPAQKLIRNVNAGTIFFGTPHPTLTKRGEWLKLNLILRLNLKLSSIRLAQAEIEAAMAAGICRRYKDAHLDVPVLSICETKTTKVPRGFFSSELHVLVDKEFAETTLMFEELMETEADHLQILRCIRGTAVYEAVVNFLLSAKTRDIQRSPTTSSGPNTREAVNDEMTESEDLEEPEPLNEDSIETLLNTTDRSSNELLPVLVDFVSHEKTLEIPCHMIKEVVQNPAFFGRQEVLKQIDETLLPETQGNAQQNPRLLQSFAICGLGGVGKTQIAIEYVYSRRDKYDAVFWLEADEPTKIAEGFGHIAASLGFADASDKDRVISRNVALGWLSNPLKRPSSSATDTLNTAIPEATWLIVFNNVDELASLRNYWPTGSSGSVLITSRDPMAKKGRRGIDLESFPTSQGAAFLRKMLSSYEETPENIEGSIALAERFGGLPLAITQIAALIDRWDMTIDEFLVHYEKETSRPGIVQAKPELLQEDSYYYKHTLFTVWAFEGLTAGANVLLCVLSFLNPDGVQESLFTNELPKPILEDFPCTEDLYIGARTELIKVSLVKRVKEANQLTLHRLVQDVIQVHVLKDQASKVFDYTVNLVLKAWPTGFLQFDHDMATWDRSEAMLQHILKLQHVYRGHISWRLSLSTERGIAQLLLFAGWYLLERSDFYSAQPLFLHALEVCRRHSSKMEDILADSLFSLSALSVQINDDRFKILEYAKEHFQVRLRLRDGSQHAEDRLATAHGELGQVYMLVGQYDESIRQCKIAIEITEKSPRFLSGNDWPTWSHCHQAFALTGLKREAEAEELLLATINYWTPRSKNHTTGLFPLGLVYRCLSYIQSRRGNWLQSFETSKLALRHFQKTVGKNNRYTSQVCSNLGFFHFKLAQYETARIYFSQAVSGFKVHKWYAAELARSYFRFSELQKAEGDVGGAAEYLSEATRLYAGLKPDRDPDSTISAEDFEQLVPIPHR